MIPKRKLSGGTVWDTIEAIRALPTGISLTSLRTSPIVSDLSPKVLSQDSTKSRKLTRGGLMLAAKLGPISVQILVKSIT